MIGELTDKEILDYLMTSDFNESLSPDECKFLLLKFRYFYRFTSSKNERFSEDIISLNKKYEKDTYSLNEKMSKLTSELKDIEEKYKNTISRKLSLNERIFGKIKENK